MTSSPTVINLVRASAGLCRAEEDAALLKVALDNLDNLRAALLDGRIKAFFAVGLSADHATYGWSGKRSPTTVLELYGAWHSMSEHIGAFES